MSAVQGSQRTQIRARPINLQRGDVWCNATVVGVWGNRRRHDRTVTEVCLLDGDNRQQVVELDPHDVLTVWRRVRPPERAGEGG